MASLSSEFVMKDLGSLNYILSINVTRHEGGLFLSQQKYDAEIIDRAGMSACKPTQTLVNTKPKVSSKTVADLVFYIDVDWGGCPDTRRLTSGYFVFLGDNLILWSSKCQPTLSRSSAEGEYRGVANVVSESCWIRNLLLELHCPVRKATLIYCDNVSAIYLSGNPVQHQRTKHILYNTLF
ncbi:uncharacterized mitochondrial protein AtMg00810-like [Trifolium pratense]|uniref:uncharacterized mitochondrial protein AtMg00810-like n=1 Tax=Trifolium pratense TaxID=57577 RepID=UPI001E690ED2|nr:uncharacterized mitochondrial protein AtMg00810-like [Trifolium pratense]